MIRAGRMRDETVHQKHVLQSKNEFGEEIRDWQDQGAPIRCSVRATTGKEIHLADKKYAEVTHQVVMRFGPDIKPQDRLLFGIDIFEVEFVDNVMRRDRKLTVLCKEYISD